MLRAIKRFFRIRQRVFEFNADNGLINTYAIRLAHGDGKELPETERNRLRLERRRLVYRKRGVVVSIRRKRA